MLVACGLVFSFATACDGEGPGKPSDRPELTATDCLACHGRRSSTDEIEQIAADIIDTHYDDHRLEPEAGLSTDETLQFEGFVFEAEIAWAPEGTGYVLRDGEDACAASCHSGHDADRGINRQWSVSGHANVRAEAFEREFSSGVCLRCHSGIGFASYVDPANDVFPDWRAPEDTAGHRITCNACHDAQAYPTAEAPRLRFDSDTAVLTSGSQRAGTAVVDGEIRVGSSAMCVVCHQGRESGSSLYETLVAAGAHPDDETDEQIDDLSFTNPHYFGAGAVLFSLKGWEYHVADEQVSAHAVKSWTETQIQAAFNLMYADSDPGAYVHNYRYVAQLLRDARESLRDRALGGVRPATAEDRSATDYSAGGAR